MKQYRILIPILILLFPLYSSAGVYISEIMYDVSGSDSGREWIEISNGGGSSVDVSGWKFLESTGASNHSLTSIQGVTTLSSGSSGVITSDPTKFLLDYPGFAGNLFKASFSSLNNTSGTILIKDSSLGVQDQVTYSSSQGAGGDGNSLQKGENGWTVGVPTPGVSSGNNSNSNSTTTASTDITPPPSTSSESVDESSAHSSPVPLSDIEPKLDFEVSGGRDRITMVGNTLTFLPTVTRIQGTAEQNISYMWSFGDGTSQQGSLVNHAYELPGEYIVVLNAYYSDKQAVSRLTVKVVQPEVMVGFSSDAIEVTNKSKTEMNLEGWRLVSERKMFTFPKDTIIPPGKKIAFANSTTGILSNSVHLLNPPGKEMGMATKIVTETLVTSPTSSPADVSSLQAKVEELKNKIAATTQVGSPTVSPSTRASLPKVNPVVKSTQKTPASTQTANAVTVFEAKKSAGFIGSLFSWPTKGFNLVKHLFVED
jgi:hypothetical protein